MQDDPKHQDASIYRRTTTVEEWIRPHQGGGKGNVPSREPSPAFCQSLPDDSAREQCGCEQGEDHDADERNDLGDDGGDDDDAYDDEE